MEKTEKLKVTNTAQFQKLVEELEKNPSLAVGFRRGTVPSNFKGQWEDIGKILNSLGPPIRSGDGWQKVWRDLKFKVKKKMVANKIECHATGGGIFKQISLSPLEEAVANLLQFQKQIHPEGDVLGCNELIESAEQIAENVQIENIEIVPPIEVNEDLTSTSIPVPPLRPSLGNNSIRDKNSAKKKKNCFSHGELLLKHSTEQAKLLSNISSSLGSIKRSLRDFDKRQKQLLDLEAQKIKLLEERTKIDRERNKREEEIHVSELKINSLKVVIKEKELELLNKRLDD